MGDKRKVREFKVITLQDEIDKTKRENVESQKMQDTINKDEEDIV